MSDSGDLGRAGHSFAADLGNPPHGGQSLHVIHRGIRHVPEATVRVVSAVYGVRELRTSVICLLLV